MNHRMSILVHIRVKRDDDTVCFIRRPGNDEPSSRNNACSKVSTNNEVPFILFSSIITPLLHSVAALPSPENSDLATFQPFLPKRSVSAKDFSIWSGVNTNSSVNSL